MEANINNFLFKLDTTNDVIEVYINSEASRPYGFIHVKPNITEKEFHYEISDWFIHNSSD
jgi:hypothetical protein